jgi:hypothetical protein
MDAIKLQAPEGVTSASVGGQEYRVDDVGQVDVPSEHAVTLYGFGFGNAPEPTKGRKSSKPAADAAPADPAPAA